LPAASRAGRRSRTRSCLAEAGIEPSIGSIGDSYEDVLAETINGIFKVEVIHLRGPWCGF
jgi:transposase InsO family protein